MPMLAESAHIMKKIVGKQLLWFTASCSAATLCNSCPGRQGRGQEHLPWTPGFPQAGHQRGQVPRKQGSGISK